uniref:Reverse transcriptase Ty1/copia-type domain-containing protein n=1 Tax=Eucampia antarctica TaxID=49252 RepID=A0A7S2RES4_9STRA|mmetsp:Transcript_21283/g.20443  ORF Transcript_21283/g.20443 Transcript_21283/m.20443 type:complete len:188 (+) Transcript_21283:101-664(+)
MAKLLYMSKRARVDMSTAIEFLRTRLSKITIEDWDKLLGLLQYIKGTINLKRVLVNNGLHCMSTYVDASYTTHMDMKGHTGGLISLGKGTIHTKSSNQKINTKSSTESEVVDAGDFIPWTMWSRRIIKEQGYGMKRTLFYQDNDSAMKMEKNGLKSCGDKSRNINIKYFFIKDVLEKKEIDLKHCET